VTESAYITDAVRTPFGRFRGALAGVRPDDLATVVVQALLERAPELDPAQIEDVLFGDANGAGEDNRNVGRMAALLAGLPTSVPGSTVNRLCGSSLDAAMQASRLIETGDAEVVLAGGVESMSRAPWVVLKPERAYPQGHETMYSTTLGWRIVNAQMPAEWTISLGESTEKLAGLEGIGREAQDAYALRSHQRAAAAWDAGFYDPWVVPVPGVELARDESIRADSTLEKLAKLKPAFSADGTVTAGNASPLNDGASAMLIVGESRLGQAGLTPLARVDVTAVELNEAFAAQCLADFAHWPQLDPEIVNVNGGAIAIGHPLGASGTRVLGGLAHALHAKGGGFGLAAICIGVGQGLAVVLEGV
jgi:acetyl-CoA acetyltransferase family protein